MNGLHYIHARYTDSGPNYEPPDKRQIDAIDDYVNGLPKEGMRYFRLAVNHDDEEVRHELWFIHMFFYEYILLNPQKETIWIMAMGETRTY